MNTKHLLSLIVAACGITLLSTLAAEDAKKSPEKPKLNRGEGPGWRALGGDDFVNVNGKEDTWTWKDGVAYCTGQPVSVIRSTKTYTNFELVLEWRHRKYAGNSGVFLWTPKETLDALKGPGLPGGIEVQVLDLGYEEKWEKERGKKPDWFTSHGDVFPVKDSTMKPFPPVAPNGRRSFPSKRLTKGVDQWNHYHISAIDGVVRLSVNGEEVSGGSDCNPATGYLCLESEGSPIEFRNLRIKELP